MKRSIVLVVVACIAATSAAGGCRSISYTDPKGNKFFYGNVFDKTQFAELDVTLPGGGPTVKITNYAGDVSTQAVMLAQQAMAAVTAISKLPLVMPAAAPTQPAATAPATPSLFQEPVDTAASLRACLDQTRAQLRAMGLDPPAPKGEGPTGLDRLRTRLLDP
jgi:hypothetical protein